MSLTSLEAILSREVVTSVSELDFNLRNWDRNPRIAGLLSQTVLKGGKRLRPMMTFMFADLLGVDHARIAPFARMIELVHASTLAHDDVVDEARVRRGEPSINAVASNKKAVLAGDYLLSYVLEEIANFGRGELVIEMARIIADLAEGEWLQIENTHKTNLSWADIELVALKKTGSVLRWSCSAPALLKDCSHDFVQRCRRLGNAIGIAFQLTDDILDFKRKDGAEGADIKNGVINSVIFEALCFQYDRDALDMTSIGDLSTIASIEPAIAKVRTRVDALVAEAHDLLHALAEEIEARDGYRNDQALAALDMMVLFLSQRI